MASYNIARFIFFSITLVALFVPHECVDDSKETLAKVAKRAPIFHDCYYSHDFNCGDFTDDCWCCDYDDHCYEYRLQCLKYCAEKKKKNPRKIVS
ncbi:hypothetical protein ACP275_08G149300 [Erythranthe tilingii]